MRKKTSKPSEDGLRECADLTRGLLAVSREELQKKAKAYKRKRDKKRNSD